MDQSYIAIIKLSGFGRPEQVEREFRQTLVRMLELEFGLENARLTSLTRMAYDGKEIKNSPLLPDDSVDITDSTHNMEVER